MDNLLLLLTTLTVLLTTGMFSIDGFKLQTANYETEKCTNYNTGTYSKTYTMAVADPGIAGGGVLSRASMEGPKVPSEARK